MDGCRMETRVRPSSQHSRGVTGTSILLLRPWGHLPLERRPQTSSQRGTGALHRLACYGQRCRALCAGPETRPWAGKAAANRCSLGPCRGHLARSPRRAAHAAGTRRVAVARPRYVRRDATPLGLGLAWNPPETQVDDTPNPPRFGDLTTRHSTDDDLRLSLGLACEMDGRLQDREGGIDGLVLKLANVRFVMVD